MNFIETNDPNLANLANLANPANPANQPTNPPTRHHPAAQPTVWGSVFLINKSPEGRSTPELGIETCSNAGGKFQRRRKGSFNAGVGCFNAGGRFSNAGVTFQRQAQRRSDFKPLWH